MGSGRCQNEAAVVLAPDGAGYQNLVVRLM